MLDDVTPRAYFRRLNDHQFRATEHVSGAWATTEQHVSPALGLLAHAIEVHRDARRDDQLPLARLSYDIFGTIPIDVVDIEVEVVRPGSTIELVEARLRYAGRVALVLRAWLMKRYETAAFAAAPLGNIEPPDRMVPWDPSTFWPGGFVSSVEVRRAEQEPGRAVFWLRTSVVLVDGEPVSDLARAVGLFDMANGVTPRVASSQLAFPNVDLTAHLFEAPRGEWLGFDTSVNFGANGIGLTHSTIHDLRGPVGTIAQCLTLRPRG